MNKTGKKRTMTWRRRRKGQALVEFALMGILLGMLLAGAVDLGRAYYTSVVVTNMAGEGAAYAALYPDRDLNSPVAGVCSQFTVASYQNIQDRAKKVATDRGLIISNTRASVAILDSNNNVSVCTCRRIGNLIKVKVTYQINDLFLPGLLGLNNITINKYASQRMVRSSYNYSSSGCSN